MDTAAIQKNTQMKCTVKNTLNEENMKNSVAKYSVAKCVCEKKENKQCQNVYTKKV